MTGMFFGGMFLVMLNFCCCVFLSVEFVVWFHVDIAIYNQTTYEEMYLDPENTYL